MTMTDPNPLAPTPPRRLSGTGAPTARASLSPSAGNRNLFEEPPP